MLLGLNWSLGVTNFAKDTISVVLHSLLVDIPIGAVQEQETVANGTEIPSDAGTCRLYVHSGGSRGGARPPQADLGGAWGGQAPPKIFHEFYKISFFV